MKEAHFEAKKIKVNKNLAFQLCYFMLWHFSTRRALKLTFVYFQLKLYTTLQAKNYSKNVIKSVSQITYPNCLNL